MLWFTFLTNGLLLATYKEHVSLFAASSYHKTVTQLAAGVYSLY